jgi:hypothetical protein
MRPRSGEVLHFSEDPTITRFRPHVAATARQPEAYVWALDAEQAQSYWFPRQCPRVLAWPGPETSRSGRRSRSVICSPATRRPASSCACCRTSRTSSVGGGRHAAVQRHPVAQRPALVIFEG